MSEEEGRRRRRRRRTRGGEQPLGRRPPNEQAFALKCCSMVVLQNHGVVRGGYRTTLSTTLEPTTISYFSVYGVVPWVIQSPENKGLSDLVLMNVSGFCLWAVVRRLCDLLQRILFTIKVIALRTSDLQPIIFYSRSISLVFVLFSYMK